MQRKKPTILKSLEKKNNDYSKLEPFTNDAPIKSSIIIPFYNSFNTLKKTITNLSNHQEIIKNSDKFEIIINDGSRMDLPFSLNIIPCRFTYVYYRKNMGRSYARNKGVSLAKNELLIFLDSDVLLPTNYFREVWKIHNKTNKAVVCGLAESILLRDKKTRLVNSDNVKPEIKHDFRYIKEFRGKEYKLLEETNNFKFFGNLRVIGPWTLPKMVITHNLSVRRNETIKVKGFDERFKSWGYEDVHFGAKLIANNCFIIPLLKSGVLRIHERKKKFSDKNRKLYERLIKKETV